MSGEQSATSESFVPFVWISSAGASPGTAVVGTPIANPVTNADLNNLGPGVNVVSELSEDITTMSNAVPQNEFTQAAIVETTSETENVIIAPTTAVDVIAESTDSLAHTHPDAQATIINVNESHSSVNVEHPGAEVLASSINHNNQDVIGTIGIPAGTLICTNADMAKFYLDSLVDQEEKKKKLPRRRLSPAHREMIIDLVFNEKKTSREVARFMALPQSTVMSVVQVFKKEHRIHKKVATGRKRRLTALQEFQLFEMSKERENTTVEEIRAKFLSQNPEFGGEISKTTIYRTIERGKKGHIGLHEVRHSIPSLYAADSCWQGEVKKVKSKGKSTLEYFAEDSNGAGDDSSINLMDPGSDPLSHAIAGKQRKSLSIAEREMIISLFFNENRTIREVSEFLHLAKSTVSSVVQVFKKEHRIQRKTSTGRKKKLSDEQELMIMDIVNQKEDITIEETRTRFLDLNPGVPPISKSTVYRIMENCQSKWARSDMEVFVGTFVHSTDKSDMEIVTDSVLGIINSKIEFLENIQELDHLKAEYGFSDSNVFHMSENQFMMPGFVDTHVHASQFPNNGLALDLPLLEWLQRYTFPTEANFSDSLYAREVYSKVVDRLLKSGTTTASYYATIHSDASRVLADVVVDKGQRALVGKVNMTRNCPEYYKETSLADSVSDTENFIRYVKGLQSALVSPAITPRFAITCPEQLMMELGDLASKYGCHIQTHLSETRAETDWVRELFPWSKSYTDVYDRSKILGEKTILAHCIWLSDDEINTLRDKGCGVSHCPTSNFSLKSGVCDVRKLLSLGLKVGLGSDCSGGYSPSLLVVLRQALTASNVLFLEDQRQRGSATPSTYKPISYKEAFKMATLGGARVLNMENKIGNFEIDKQFDAILVDIGVQGSPIDIFSKKSDNDKVQQFLFNGDDRNIVRVYVAGKKLIDRCPRR